MSLEAKIEELTQAVCRLIDVVGSLDNLKSSPPLINESLPVNPFPVVEKTPGQQVAQEVSAPSAPFKDEKGLMDYLMGAYCQLGEQKGAQVIESALKKHGVQGVNEIKPDQYNAFYATIEGARNG